VASSAKQLFSFTVAHFAPASNVAVQHKFKNQGRNMLTVHHLNESRSQRILWLLEELGLPYEIVFHTRDPKTRLAPPSLTAIHPLGKSPVIVDGGLTVIESGAIIDYVIRRQARAAWRRIRLRPTSTATSSGCTMPRARPCCR
jgi:hypothetical protein